MLLHKKKSRVSRKFWGIYNKNKIPYKNCIDFKCIIMTRSYEEFKL